MNSRWLTVASLSLAVFASLVIAWQFLHHDDVAALREWIARGRIGAMPGEISSSLFQSHVRGKQLAAVSDIVKRDQMIVQAAGLCRYVDLVLPPGARVFMPDMTGPTNWEKRLYFYYVTYYLFPREIGVSVDQPTRMTQDRFLGRTAGSEQEMRAHGYDAIVDFPADQTLTLKLLRPLSELPVQQPVTPAWFGSDFDALAAFLLPLLTAVAGRWLFRILFPSLGGSMPLLEQLACGLGLGMMTLAALTLGIKLCGGHGHRLLFLVTAVSASAEILCHGKLYWAGMTDVGRRLACRPVLIAVLLAGTLVFLILFRLAGLQGVTDYDAVTGWLLKAKIIHLYAGSEMVQWFSNPRLANAHLDYPTLVPSLHAATYDAIGHVDEFVTKFWPVWMLLFLLAALASLNQGGTGRFYASYFGLLGILLLPATQKYVQMEGGVLPMVFFTVLGFVQYARWLIEKDPARLGLGLTLMFGAAMTKFEGFIFLVLLGSWLLLVPSARPPLKSVLRCWPAMTFCLLAVLPFFCLRLQIPVLNYESSRAGHVLAHPATLLSTLSNWLAIFMIQLARLFLNPDFAYWNVENGELHWIGKWNGISSLYNPSTLALGWQCLLMTTVLWFANPTRRHIAGWILLMFLGAVAALSGVFACFVDITSLDWVISNYTGEIAGVRYLLPVLLAWFAATLTVLFADARSTGTIHADNLVVSPVTASQPSP